MMATAIASQVESMSANAARDRADVRTFARCARELLTVTSALSNAATTAEVANVVLGIGLGVVEASRGFICSYSRGGMRMLHAVGYDPILLQRVRALRVSDDTPLTRCLQTGQPVYLCSVDEYRATYPWAYAQFGAVSATQAHAALPLIHNGVVIGGLGISFERPTAFGAVDRTFTMLLAQATAGAMARAMDFDAARASREEAEILARTREEVLAVVAHDLRNPLNLIKNTAELLVDIDPPPETRKQLLAISSRAVDQMNRLIGDLLDVQRLKLGQLSLEVCDCDPSLILGHVAETVRPAADEKAIRLDVEYPSQAIRFRGDASRIVQAIGNLATNAVKFTPARGAVRLSARRGKRVVVFSVSDTGPGLSSETKSHLFEKFWQAHRDRRGVGLGLAIVRGIAEAHKGRITVRSRLEMGSCFSMILPLQSTSLP